MSRTTNTNLPKLPVEPVVKEKKKRAKAKKEVKTEAKTEIKTIEIKEEVKEEAIKKNIFVFKCDSNKFLTIYQYGIFAQFSNGIFKTEDIKIAQFLRQHYSHLLTEEVK